MAPAIMEPSVKYHPLVTGALTGHCNPVAGQCLAGSLTGAVAS